MEIIKILTFYIKNLHITARLYIEHSLLDQPHFCFLYLMPLRDCTFFLNNHLTYSRKQKSNIEEKGTKQVTCTLQPIPRVCSTPSVDWLVLDKLGTMWGLFQSPEPNAVPKDPPSSLVLGPHLSPRFIQLCRWPSTRWNFLRCL